MELQSRYLDLQDQGLGVAVVTYDPVATLAGFADARGIEIPLLSDEGSATIREYDLLNHEMDPARAPEERREMMRRLYGIPYPGTFMLDTAGRVTSRFFEAAYQERSTVSSIAVRLGDAIAGADDRAATRIATDERESESARVGVLRDRLVAELGTRLAGVHQNGDPSRRLPNTANIRFEGADAEAVMSNMDPVAVSTGSACSAGSIEPSEVLTAMGLSHDAAFESVRFSLGRFTTEADIEAGVQAAVTAVGRVRALAA